MNKLEWFELIEQAEELNVSILYYDSDDVIEQATKLINMIHNKANDAAETSGWFSELEEFIDTMTFNIPDGFVEG
jgi:hypothetical protein